MKRQSVVAEDPGILEQQELERQITKQIRCVQTVYEGPWSHAHQCSRTGTLKYKKKLYCKQHHPPSIEARAQAARRCTWEWDKNTPCNTVLRPKDKGPWCQHCRSREANYVVLEKARAYDRVTKLLDQCEAGDIRVYSLPEKIRRAMKLKGLQKP